MDMLDETYLDDDEFRDRMGLAPDEPLEPCIDAAASHVLAGAAALTRRAARHG